MKSRNIVSTTIFLVLGFLALSPIAQAVTPAPDGGYPGGNTAEGQNALLSLSTGGYNTAVGWSSLGSNTSAGFNTAIGAGTLFANTASYNTATGAAALLSNSTGGNNTANGALALESNTTGSSNTANGAFALLNNTASNNTANGFEALQSNTTGNENTAVGVSALQSNTIGTENTAIGVSALQSNTTASFNTAIGVSALQSNTTGGINTAIGHFALHSNTEGGNNQASGEYTLYSNTTGHFNTANGYLALQGNITGNYNTATGAYALNNATGSKNTALGVVAGSNVTTASNVICIGYNVVGNNVNDSCYIGNIFPATSAGGIGVFVNSNGRLGTMTSSRRFKEEIKPLDKASEAVLLLKPVSFRYKREVDPEGTSAVQFGLVAEDVEKVNPDLIVRDKEGKPYSVRYDQVNAMLLNEFLKEHRKVNEQQASIAQLKSTVVRQEVTIAQQQKSFEAKLAEEGKQIEALASNLQRVSAQIEMSKPAPQTVLNNQ